MKKREFLGAVAHNNALYAEHPMTAIRGAPGWTVGVSNSDPYFMVHFYKNNEPKMIEMIGLDPSCNFFGRSYWDKVTAGEDEELMKILSEVE